MREGWQSVELGFFMEFKNGLNADKDAYGSGIKFVNVMDIFRSPELHADNITGTVQASPNAASEYSVVHGDILFNRTSETPEDIAFASVYLDVDPITFGGFVIRGRQTRKLLDSEFCKYVFRTDDVRRETVRRCQGAVRANIGQQDLSKVTLKIPPLAEQRKIAAILRTWDEALEKLSALRAAKAKRHLGLTNSLVFGGMQLEGYHRSDEFASHRWFTLPSSWGCHPIGELAMEVSERNISGDAFEVLSCSKYDGFVRSLEYFKKQVFSADLTGYKKIWRGDFGFPSNHVEEGSIGLQNLTETGVVSPIYTVFRFNPALVLGEYAFSVLKTEVYRHIFAVSTSASVDRRGSLRWKDFARLPFPLPPLAEQESIAEVLNTSRSEIDALDAEIEAVSRQKRGLMQKLLTGEWRVEVSDDEEAAA